MKKTLRTMVAAACFLMPASFIATSANAAILYFSQAVKQGSVVVLQAATFSNSGSDYLYYKSIGAQGYPFSGPGYYQNSTWEISPLVANTALMVVAELEVNSPATGSHCSQGRHRWTRKADNVTSILFSVQDCYNWPSGGGGGGGGGACSVPYPVTSVLSLSGKSRTLPGANRSALTRIGAGEDGRNIILDEFAVIDLSSGRLVPDAVSDGFELPLAAASGFSASSEIESLIETAPKGQFAETAQTAIRAAEVSRAGSRTAMLIQHQREHPPNANFTPTPQITFMAQPFADLRSQGQRGFAVVDVGESGQVHDVRVWSDEGESLAGIINSAVSQGLRTSFRDHRRHDHRVYLAFQIYEGMLQMIGDPVVTLPMCGSHCF